MTEAQITRAVVDHWRALGLPDTLLASIPNQWAHGQYGLTPGLPDFVVLARGLPVGFLELKTERGRVSAAQIAFRDRCERLSIPHAIARGRDEPIEILRKWGVVR